MGDLIEIGKFAATAILNLVVVFLVIRFIPEQAKMLWADRIRQQEKLETMVGGLEKSVHGLEALIRAKSAEIQTTQATNQILLNETKRQISRLAEGFSRLSNIIVTLQSEDPEIAKRLRRSLLRPRNADDEYDQ